MLIIDPFEGHFRRLVRCQMEAPVPATLSRVVMQAAPFDREGFVIPHTGSWTGYGRNVALSHPDDWETMARYLFQYMGDYFAVLNVDSTLITKPGRAPHPLLRLGEFFAQVHKDAVISQRIYYWAEDAPQRRLPHLSDIDRMEHNEVLRQADGYVPRRVI